MTNPFKHVKQQKEFTLPNVERTGLNNGVERLQEFFDAIRKHGWRLDSYAARFGVDEFGIERVYVTAHRYVSAWRAFFTEGMV